MPSKGHKKLRWRSAAYKDRQDRPCLVCGQSWLVHTEDEWKWGCNPAADASLRAWGILPKEKTPLSGSLLLTSSPEPRASR